ncbi:cationic peroxidase 1-like [Fagus crenata]
MAHYYSTSSIQTTIRFCLLFSLLVGIVSAQLSSNFYATSCPNALSTIKTAVNSAVSSEKRMGASLLRLHFHDCFGCDASVLLDDNATFTGEKTAGPNNNSLRGFNVIDTIKSQLENLCPNIVSCADILTVVARDSVVALGGTTWTVPLGRRDSTTASLSAANSNIPAPTLNLSGLISAFSNKGFTAKEMVALSGSHTIGQARCTVFRTRLYNENNINSSYATSLKSNCPSTGGDNNLAPLDVTSPTSFDNAYFKNLLNNKGLLHSDQQLFNGGSTDSQVNAYSSNMGTFLADFANAMVKMGNLSPLTGTSGQLHSSAFHGLSPLSLSRTALSLRFSRPLSPLTLTHGLIPPPLTHGGFTRQWGRDFRLDYRGLGCLTQNFPDVPVMALTATATQSVREDEMKALRIPHALVLERSFDRPN